MERLKMNTAELRVWLKKGALISYVEMLSKTPLEKMPCQTLSNIYEIIDKGIEDLTEDVKDVENNGE